ncbi:MAG: ABC transporter ATP-binding protein [Chloroherpetonaceae bacterium]|nr:ABC transporter ATP-binding protein [Chthonomonadaceae bacterium]MDW8206812.1 ABC transporter ATP-binding protein [Chloroherpetonaceae bacterium]
MRRARDTVAAPSPLVAPSDPSSEPVLRMQGITKRYGATLALDQVDFSVNRGEIHALLGENGAGKSTLMHVLSGLTRPDAGAIWLEGREVRLTSPRQARAHGIAMVHQHFTLVPAFTVAENLQLDRPVVDPIERARSLGWSLDPQARVHALPVGAQQRVEIVKALATDARLLIFDEPTAVLSPPEVEELFVVLRRLRDEGRTIILIAHKLAEILAVSDRVTVLRRGRNVVVCRTAETSAPELAGWMIGAPRALDAAADGDGGGSVAGEVSDPVSPASHAVPVPAEGPASRAGGLVVRGLTVPGDRGEHAIRMLDLQVRRGEISGIGGVDGNGQTELAEALAGLRPIAGGQLQWDGGPFRPGVTPRIGYIPQDRRRAGLAVTLSIAENLLFDAVREPEFRIGPFLRRGALYRHALALARQFDIRTGDLNLPASALSGGNQQKIVVARAFRSDPELIIAVNPTRGLDIGATRFVHAQLRRARERGAAVVLISTDLDELMALSDRAAILASGQLTELSQQAVRTADIGLLMGGMRVSG